MKDKIYNVVLDLMWELDFQQRFNFYFENNEVNIDILDPDLNIVNSIYLDFDNIKSFKTRLFKKLKEIAIYYDYY